MENLKKEKFRAKTLNTQWNSKWKHAWTHQATWPHYLDGCGFCRQVSSNTEGSAA